MQPSVAARSPGFAGAVLGQSRAGPLAASSVGRAQGRASLWGPCLHSGVASGLASSIFVPGQDFAEVWATEDQAGAVQLALLTT